MDDGRWRTGDGGQRTEDEGQRMEDRGSRMEDRGSRTRGWMIEDGGPSDYKTVRFSDLQTSNKIYYIKLIYLTISH